MKGPHRSIHRVYITAPVFLLAILSAVGLRAGEIHDAVKAGDLAKVRALLEADPTLLESKGNRGETPLDLACFGGPPFFQKEVAVARFLIDEGANVNAKEDSGYTPLNRASAGPGQDLGLIRRLIDKGADVNAPGPNGRTPLSSAAQSGNLDVAKLLVAQGADVNASNDYHGPINTGDIGGTILQVAINYAPTEEMAKWLVEGGAKLNQKDPFGNTELHLATLKGYADLVRLLVAHGADVHAPNEGNRTALYFAAKHGYRRAADTLIAAGAKKSAIVETNYGKAPQLAVTLEEGEAYLWFLGGSGYAVKTRSHLLLFNPPGIDESPEAGLANGHLSPTELAGQRITALLTWAWSGALGNMQDFIDLARRMQGVSLVTALEPTLSGAGEPGFPPYHLAAPHENFSAGDVTVQPIPAMAGGMGGGGLGYLVEADGVKIFHAGFHAAPSESSEQVEKFQKEIDFLRPFGPIDIAMLSVKSHIDVAYGPYFYLLDQLAPKAIYLLGANQPEEHPKCAEVLRARKIPVAYPERGGAVGERFHFLPGRTPATPQARGGTTPTIQGTREPKGESQNESH